MVENNPLKEYYEWSIKNYLEDIRFKSEENKIFQRIRENHGGNWKIVELCRELMFDNVKFSQYLMKGIENDRRAIKELG
jgi:hypothetical protein